MQREHEGTEGMKYVKMDNPSNKFPYAYAGTAAYTQHTMTKLEAYDVNNRLTLPHLISSPSP